MIKFVSLSTSGDHFKKTEKSIHGEFSLISAHLLQEKIQRVLFCINILNWEGKQSNFLKTKKISHLNRGH